MTEEIKTEISTDCSYYKDVVKEEIIIDGVNVAGCGFRHKDTDNQCHIALAFSEDYGECWHCEQIENCYYKQLKRLEQENKKLRQQYNCYACDTCQGKEDYRNMKRHCENAIKTVHTYRSALEEIKHILEIHKDELEECLYNDIDGMIQTKINEVLND